MIEDEVIVRVLPFSVLQPDWYGKTALNNAKARQFGSLCGDHSATTPTSGIAPLQK